MLEDQRWVQSVEKVDMNLHMAACYSNWNATLGVALQLEMKHRSQPLKISCVLALRLTMAWDVKVSLEKGKEAWLLKGKGWTGSFLSHWPNHRSEPEDSEGTCRLTLQSQTDERPRGWRHAAQASIYWVTFWRVEKGLWRHPGTVNQGLGTSVYIVMDSVGLPTRLTGKYTPSCCYWTHFVCAVREVHSCNVHPSFDHFLGLLHGSGNGSCVRTVCQF